MSATTLSVVFHKTKLSLALTNSYSVIPGTTPGLIFSTCQRAC